MNSSTWDINGSCQKYYHIYPDPTNSYASIAFFGIVYTAICLLGIIGNASVVYVTLSNKTLQTIQNFFILNLSVAGIFVCILSVPVTPITNTYKEWYFGKLMCHLIPWVQGTSLFISTFTLTAIAIDRYGLIMHPHIPPMSQKSALYLILLIWTVSGAVTVPYAYYMKIVSYSDLCGEFCDEDWPPKMRRGFTILYLISQFVLPVIVITVCYVKVLNRLQTRINTKLARLSEQNEVLNAEESSCQVAISCRSKVCPTKKLPLFPSNIQLTNIHFLIKSTEQKTKRNSRHVVWDIPVLDTVVTVS